VAVDVEVGDGVIVGVGEAVGVDVAVSVRTIDWVNDICGVGEFVVTIPGRISDDVPVGDASLDDLVISSDVGPARTGNENRRSKIRKMIMLKKMVINLGLVKRMR
jgi:hypothetical protein